MKSTVLYCMVLVLVGGSCKKNTGITVGAHHEEIIALQPLDAFNNVTLNAISWRLAGFYNKQVMILPPRKVPVNFRSDQFDMYSADSILRLLSSVPKGKVVQVIGFTHHPLYTIKEKNSATGYATKIFGMGYQPGNCCVVSDYQLMAFDTSVLYRRVTNVVLHEVGHNMDLGHCDDALCIMSANNGSIAILDHSGDDYCKECKKKLAE